MSAHVEITAPPDLVAALAALGAIVLIDVAAIRYRRATISRWCRHQLWHRPGITLTAAALLGLHLSAELPADPFRWIAVRLGQEQA